MIPLKSRESFSLEIYHKVAWLGEGIAIADSAIARIDEARSGFLSLLESDDDIVIYGVTSGYGQNAYQRFDKQQRQIHARKISFATSAAFGDPAPERLVRGIVFARLVNFIEGHAAVSSDLVGQVAAMLDENRLPPVPTRGIGCAGEIQPLGHLFNHLSQERVMGVKENLALVNGSPCASALAADVALSARRRLDLAYRFFALSIEALRAPLAACDSSLDFLWDAPEELCALRQLRELTHGGDPDRRSFQAPVSWRILPRVLAQAEHAVGRLESVANSSLSSITDNPVYIPPDDNYPLGRVFSTGGITTAWSIPRLMARQHPGQTLQPLAIGRSPSCWTAKSPIFLISCFQRRMATLASRGWLLLRTRRKRGGLLRLLCYPVRRVVALAKMTSGCPHSGPSINMERPVKRWMPFWLILELLQVRPCTLQTGTRRPLL